MSEQFLYEELNTFEKYKYLKTDVPYYIKDNLNPKLPLRPYQEKAFAYFIHYLENPVKNNTIKQSLHLLFNMATGSGKTLIMAGLILYLYKKGYRNFLFFVGSTTILEKTKSNFLNPSVSKYLFKEMISIDDQRVHISLVNNFEGINENNINICFTTIQKLHTDLKEEKENSLTFQDFQDKKMVLLADEAHHFSTNTKGQLKLQDKKDKPSWENTIEQIFKQNIENLLLEFTATLNYNHKDIVQKYRNKILYRYDLKNFYTDGYSKDVCIVQTDLDLRDRILQTIILSQYKQEVAQKHRIHLKPVILFKAERTIAQSQENKANFHKIIEELTAEDIAQMQQKSNLPLIEKAFDFFKSYQMNHHQLVARLRKEFQEKHCLSVNQDSEKERLQILLNTLEDKNNLIRAIFAVEKLNEGWDVLNLFDIIRCYESSNQSSKKIKETTLREAQLIGRGARYFPFSINSIDDLYMRKFDNDQQCDLRVLEQLHYHSLNEFSYIREIQNVLRKTGIMPQSRRSIQLQLKDSFKKTGFYKHGLIYINKRVRNKYCYVQYLSDMGVSARNYRHTLATGEEIISQVMRSKSCSKCKEKKKQKDIQVKDIPLHIIQNAISHNVFFQFSSLKKYFPHIRSIRQFIQDKDYLGGLAITVQGGGNNLSNKGLLEVVKGLLQSIESEIKKNIINYKRVEKFKLHHIQSIFTDKQIDFIDNDHKYVTQKDWYAFKAHYGTSEERIFIKMLDSQIDNLKNKYDEIYCLRNERHFKIYNFKDGKGFEPDFVLFLREQTGQMITYQIFVELKEDHLRVYDQWKEDFLNKIRQKFKDQILELTIPARFQKYRLTGVPFYNRKDENKFKKNLYTALNSGNK